MTAVVTVSLWCDEGVCDAEYTSGHDDVTATKLASKQNGWSRDEFNQDFCPDHRIRPVI